MSIENDIYLSNYKYISLDRETMVFKTLIAPYFPPFFLFINIYNLVIKRERGHCKKSHIVKDRGFVGKTNKMRRSLTIVQSFQVRKLDLSQISRFCAGCCTEPGLFVPWTKDIPLVLVPHRPLLPVILHSRVSQIPRKLENYFGEIKDSWQ